MGECGVGSVLSGTSGSRSPIPSLSCVEKFKQEQFVSVQPWPGFNIHINNQTYIERGRTNRGEINTNAGEDIDTGDNDHRTASLTDT